MITLSSLTRKTKLESWQVGKFGDPENYKLYGVIKGNFRGVIPEVNLFLVFDSGLVLDKSSSQ